MQRQCRPSPQEMPGGSDSTGSTVNHLAWRPSPSDSMASGKLPPFPERSRESPGKKRSPAPRYRPERQFRQGEQIQYRELELSDLRHPLLTTANTSCGPVRIAWFIFSRPLPDRFVRSLLRANFEQRAASSASFRAVVAEKANRHLDRIGHRWSLASQLDPEKGSSPELPTR